MIYNISTQKEFDNALSTYQDLLNTEEIIFNFTNTDTYYYPDQAINLNNIKNPKLSVIINGYNEGNKKTRLIAKGIEICSDNISYTKTKEDKSAIILTDVSKKKHNFFKKLLYAILFKKLDKGYQKYDTLSLWENKFYSTNKLIEVLSEDTKVCRIYFNKLKFNSFDINYINVLQWFKSACYEIIGVGENYIDFKCSGLTYNKSKNQWSINNDYNFSKGKILPRFRVSKKITKLDKQINKIYQCTTTKFVDMNKASVNSLSIQNIEFLGNAYNGQKIGLIHIDNSKISSNINISGCSFKNIYSEVIFVQNTNNINITNCDFEYIWRFGIFANECINPLIKGCKFNHCGLETNNTSVIRADGENVQVSDNEFTDFGYNGIGAGTWHGTPEKYTCYGDITNNKLKNSYTPLMDSGAIYLWSQNGGIKVHNNIVDNYRGAYENRGIFCDDGANNYEIFNNRITNINQDTPNGYSIDARLVLNYIRENTNRMKYLPNINNKIYNNTVDGSIKFEGFPENTDVKALIYNESDKICENKTINIKDNGCYLGENIRLSKTYKDVINNVHQLEK